MKLSYFNNALIYEEENSDEEGKEQQGLNEQDEESIEEPDQEESEEKESDEEEDDPGSPELRTLFLDKDPSLLSAYQSQDLEALTSALSDVVRISTSIGESHHSRDPYCSLTHFMLSFADS